MSEPLLRLWGATVGRDPQAVAVVDPNPGRAWSRRALDEAAAEFASGLPRVARRRVALCVPNGADWFRVFLGLLSAGAVPVPIDSSEPEAAQLACARSVGASHLWRGDRLHALSPGGRRAPRSECLVKVTSGSSGAPRALPVTSAQIEADGRQICETMGIGAADGSLAAIPLGYSYGLGNLVAPLLLQGSWVLCASGAMPHALADDALRHRPTVFPAVPPLLRALVESDVPAGSLASLRLVLSAGSALAPETARAFADKFGVAIRGFYGASETGGISFDRSGEATLAGRSVGTPMEGVRVAFAKGGRFTVRSPAVLGSGRFSPADRGELNAWGELVLLGRTGRMVKVAGRRVDLSEIEAALRSLPGIRDAFAHEGPSEGSPLAAAVATDLSSADVRRLLRPRLAAWKIPQRILVMRGFPVTARGKPDARRLRQLLSAPRTATSISTLSSARQMSARR